MVHVDKIELLVYFTYFGKQKRPPPGWIMFGVNTDSNRAELLNIVPPRASPQIEIRVRSEAQEFNILPGSHNSFSTMSSKFSIFVAHWRIHVPRK